MSIVKNNSIVIEIEALCKSFLIWTESIAKDDYQNQKLSRKTKTQSNVYAWRFRVIGGINTPSLYGWMVY